MKELLSNLLKKHTMKELADAAGYNTEQSIRAILNGANMMPVYRQKKLATGLGINIETLKRAHVSDIKKLY